MTTKRLKEICENAVDLDLDYVDCIKLTYLQELLGEMEKCEALFRALASIANTPVELSHDKVALQRNEFINTARQAISLFNKDGE